MILIIWLGSCTSTPKSTKAPAATVPDDYDANGELVIKPIHAGETFTAAEDSVLVPFWYWRKIFNYITDTHFMQESAE